MSSLVLMCGLTFSGKTTLARRITAALGCDYIGLDDINDERGLWGGHGVAAVEWERSHVIAQERTRRSLARGRCVVVDDTSNLRWLRDRWRDVADQDAHSCALVYVSTPVGVITERIREAATAGERRLVRPDVLDEHVESFEAPTDEESPITYAPGDDVDQLVTRIVDRLAR